MARIVDGMLVNNGGSSSGSSRGSSSQSMPEGNVDCFGFSVTKPVAAGLALLLFFWFGLRGAMVAGIALYGYGRLRDSGRLNGGGGSGSSSGGGGGGGGFKTLSDLPPPPPSGG